MMIMSRPNRHLLLGPLSLFLIWAIRVQGFQPAQDRIQGLWIPAEEDSNVKIYEGQDGSYSGTIVWLEEPYEKDGSPVLDKLNPDPKLAQRPLDGLTILTGLKYDEKKDRYEGGRIYDPDDGKTYDCFAWFDKNDYNKLKLKGYVLGIKFLGRETTFTRKLEEENDSEAASTKIANEEL